MSIFFDGKRIVKPQAVSKLDTTRLSNVTAGSANRLVIIGQAEGGEPHSLLSFSSPSSAKSVLRDGDALRAARLAWTPSQSQPGASVVNVMRVNSAKQALNVTDFVDTNNDVALIGRSKDYGNWTKDIRVKFDNSTSKKVLRSDTSADLIKGLKILDVEDDTTIGAGLVIENVPSGGVPQLSFNNGDSVAIAAEGQYILPGPGGVGGILVDIELIDNTDGVSTIANQQETVSVEYLGVNVSVAYDPESALEFQQNLGSVINVTYTGDANTSKLSISSGILSVVSDITSESLSIDLSESSYNTMLKVANYLNSQPGIEAELSPFLLNSSMDSSYLDSVSNMELKFKNNQLTAHLGVVMDWAENNSIFVTFEKADGYTANLRIEDTGGYKNLKAVDINNSAVSLEGTNTFSDWQAVLALLETEDIDIIVPVTTSLEIVMAVKEHVNVMNNSKKERRAYYGHDLNLSIKEVTAISRELGSSFGVLASPGITLRDDDGTINNYDSSYLAACFAGIAAGASDVAVPLTGKYVNVVGLEKQYTLVEQDILLEGGVAPVEFVRNRGFRIAQGRTTYLLDNKAVFVEDSVSRVGQFIKKDVREQLENTFIGEKATLSTIASIRALLVSLLSGYERSGIITSGIDPDTGATLQAFRNISVRFENRAAYVEFEVSPVEPLNYIPITAVLTPVSIVV